MAEQPHHTITLGIGIPDNIEQFLLFGLWADPPIRGSITITDELVGAISISDTTEDV